MQTVVSFWDYMSAWDALSIYHVNHIAFCAYVKCFITSVNDSVFLSALLKLRFSCAEGYVLSYSVIIPDNRKLNAFVNFDIIRHDTETKTIFDC